MRWLIGVAIVLAILLIAHKARADGRPHTPPTLKSEIPGKVCVAIFDKTNDLVGIDCNIPKVKDNGKGVSIKKGP
jgi:hypothetical protein